MRIFVKPKAGRLVRDPRSGLPLPAEGREAPQNSFWIRRLEGGDVVPGSRKKAEPVRNVSSETQLKTTSTKEKAK